MLSPYWPLLFTRGLVQSVLVLWNHCTFTPNGVYGLNKSINLTASQVWLFKCRFPRHEACCCAFLCAGQCRCGSFLFQTSALCWSFVLWPTGQDCSGQVGATVCWSLLFWSAWEVRLPLIFNFFFFSVVFQQSGRQNKWSNFILT